MIYISHLVKDEEMKEIIARTGMGIEKHRILSSGKSG